MSQMHESTDALTNENTNMQSEPNAVDEAPKKAKKFKGFHPKRFLKNLQGRLQSSQYLYLLFCFFVPVILMYGVYVVKGIYPFYNGSPLVLDLNAQYVSYFEALRDFALGERSILYSFARSLGGEFMGIVAYYAASPLTYITVLFPKDRIQEAVLTILLIKCGLSGATFGYYLHKKSRNPKKLVIFTFSLMYALTAYAVVQQQNTMWIDAVIWLPLLAYGMEGLVYRKKYKLYVISLSVIMICNYYIGFMICIFAVLYFFYCYFSKSQSEINPYGEKLHFIRTGSRFAIFSILSAMISAFMLIAAYYSLQFGKTEFSSPSWSMEANFSIVEFLTKFLPGSYDTVEPSGLPFVYCGILTLLLLPIYFLAKKISSREKLASLAIIGVLVLSLFLNPLDLIWHGFSYPNWLNARYSFILCFLLLVVAYKAFGNIRTTSEKFILGTAAFIILFVAVAEKFEMESYITSDKKLLTFGSIWFSIAFTIILAVLLCLKLNVNHKKHSTAVAGVLAAVICAELFCNGVVCFLQLHKDVAFTSYSKYNNHLAGLRPVVNSLYEYDEGFYRSEKTANNTRNDNMGLGIRGITSSTSTLNQKAIDFVGKLGYVGRSHYTGYTGGTAVGDSLLGIKYVIDYNGSIRFDNLYEPVIEIESDKYTVYRNPNALSLAYGVSGDIKEYDFEGSRSGCFNLYNEILTAMLGDEEDVKLFSHVPNVSITADDSCEVEESLSISKYIATEGEGVVTFTYTTPKAGYYYFHTEDDDSSASDDLEINFDGHGKIDYLGKEEYVVWGGYYEENVEISINVYIPEGEDYSIRTTRNFLWYFTLDDYNRIFAKLKSEPQFEISPDSTDDHLFGSISTDENDQTILTTIPYDKGWRIYLDGEAIESYETMSALMAFDIPEGGDHSLVLKYEPIEYKIGIILSITGISAFIIICAADFVLKKTLLKSKVRVYEKDYFVLDDYDGTDTDSDVEVLESNAGVLDAQNEPISDIDEGNQEESEE